MAPTTRVTPIARRALAASFAAATAWALPACGGGNECPAPLFTAPVTATWMTASSAGSSVTDVVVRWSPSSGDSLPERYYEPSSADSVPDSAVPPIQDVTRTGTRELTFTMVNLDAFVRRQPRFATRLRFPDPMGFTSCSHPGRGDSYVVDLTFDFSPTTHTVAASFGEPLLVAGGCSVTTPGPTSGSPRGALALALALGVAFARSRRPRVESARREASRRSERAGSRDRGRAVE